MTEPVGEDFMLAAIEHGPEVRISTSGTWSTHVRFNSAVKMIRHALARRTRGLTEPDAARGLYFLQFYDFAQRHIRSVAFGRLAGAAPFVELIPDPYFYFSHGFQALRTLAIEKALPDWRDRSDAVFWRGVGSHNGRDLRGEPIRELADIPRLQLALRLRDRPHADVGVTGAWHDQPQASTLELLEDNRILRPPASMAEHARFKFQVDIDGIANAWATLERFLCGSCVLKVGTPFEMWFYPRMRAWEHFVPVRADLTDLEERQDWCLSHPGECQAIAEAGQQLAFSITLDSALDEAVQALSACRIPLPDVS